MDDIMSSFASRLDMLYVGKKMLRSCEIKDKMCVRNSVERTNDVVYMRRNKDD